MDYKYSLSESFSKGISYNQIDSEINEDSKIEKKLIYSVGHEDDDVVFFHFDEKLDPAEKDILDTIIDVHNPIPLVPLQKGDIQIYDGTCFQNLKIGPDGSHLVADSKSSIGVKWAL